jgi:hypothetical protein
MTKTPWRKSRNYGGVRPVYTRYCSLCGQKAEFKRRTLIKTLTGWQQTTGYVCLACATYWYKEAKEALARGEKVS